MKIDLTAVLPTKTNPYAKFVYAVLGVGVLLVADDTLQGDVARWVTVLAGVLTPAAVYQADSTPPDGYVGEGPAEPKSTTRDLVTEPLRTTQDRGLCHALKSERRPPDVPGTPSRGERCPTPLRRPTAAHPSSSGRSPAGP